MPGMTRTDALPVLEEMYINNGLLDSLVFRERPLLGILEKRAKKGGGKYVHVPVKYVDPQGRSATFATAQTNRTPSKRSSFDVTYRSNYAVATVDGDASDDAEGNTVMLTDLIADEMDGAIENLTNDISTEIFRNQGGARAQVGSGQGTPTVTLLDTEDVVHFEIGQLLAASANDGSDAAHALRNSGATIAVTGIDSMNGTLTAAGNWTASIAALAANDYLFVAGDFKIKIPGLDAWIPATAPAAASNFYGVDRSIHTRLGGLRFTTGKGSIEQKLLQAAALGKRHKAKFDLGVLNPIKWNELVMSLESTGRRPRMATVMGSGDAARFGYDAILMVTASGTIPIIQDPSCQSTVGWLLNTEGIVIWHSGKSLVRMIDKDGLPFMREAANDGIEFRVKSRATMTVYDPGHQMRVAV